MRKAHLGFSLLEMLVAMAILGVVLAAVLSLIVASTSFTSRSTVISDATRDLSDASGFLGDEFRQATHVFAVGAPPFVTDDASAPTIDCVSGACIAFRVPSFDAETGQLVGETLRMYRIVERVELPPVWRTDAPYSGDDATSAAVIRYVGTGVGSTVLDKAYSLVLDNVVPDASTLLYDDVARTLSISLQVGKVTRQGQLLLPGLAPLETLVYRRN